MTIRLAVVIPEDYHCLMSFGLLMTFKRTHGKIESEQKHSELSRAHAFTLSRVGVFCEVAQQTTQRAG